MADQPTLTESVKSLNKLTGSYVDETSSQIQSIVKTLQKLIPPDEYEKLMQQQLKPACESSKELAEERLLYELEKNRISLVLEIQDQNATSARLLEMIGEYDELVNALTAYAADFVNNSKDGQDASARDQSPQEEYAEIGKSTQTDDSEHTRSSRIAEISGVEQALDANLARIEKEFKQFESRSMKQLTAIQEAWMENGSIENEKKLLELISRLNVAMQEGTKS